MSEIASVTRTALIRAARKAARQAYCPYSNYAVGAALLSEKGVLFTGCNVENISYGLTTCAERNAVASALVAGHRGFVALAIAGGQERPALPCGACRQVLAEFCTPDMPVFIVLLKGGRFVRKNLGELLPEAFGELC